VLIGELVGRSVRFRLRKALAFDPVDPKTTGAVRIPPEPGREGPLLLYLHISFCEGLCPCCSFHRVVHQPHLARAYIAALRRRRQMRAVLPVAAARRFSAREQLLYDLLMKLFRGRLDIETLERRHGPRALRSLAGEIAFFRAIGALELRPSGSEKPGDGRHLALTPNGYYIWVILMREFFTGVNNLREFCRGRQMRKEATL
jgi:coproporphyrinogen III oxidase-like Fe-S oxidoreductase